MPNECAVGDCSMRSDHPHKMPGCRVVAFSTPGYEHGQQNEEQKGWEQSKLGCTVLLDNMVQGCGLTHIPEGKV